MNKERAWKLFTVVLGALIMPLAGWVWNMNSKVIELEGQVHGLEQQVAEAEQNARALIGVEKDIEYMKSSLSRIEVLVTN